MLAVVICGGRDYGNWRLVFATLDRLNPGMVIQGGARGADRLAQRWAESKEVPCLNWPARWSTQGKGAGHARNAQMQLFLAELAERGYDTLVVAFPGGTGTANMVEGSRKLGLRVMEIAE